MQWVFPNITMNHYGVQQTCVDRTKTGKKCGSRSPQGLRECRVFCFWICVSRLDGRRIRLTPGDGRVRPNVFFRLQIGCLCNSMIPKADTRSPFKCDSKLVIMSHFVFEMECTTCLRRMPIEQDRAGNGHMPLSGQQ